MDNIKTVDSDLLKIIKQSEIGFHRLYDEYVQFLNDNKGDRQIENLRIATQKELDRERKDIKLKELKQREADLLREEAERNRERLARKERIVKREGKMLMTRS